MSVRVQGLIAVVIVVGAPLSVLASPAYPDAIQAKLGLEVPPSISCALCHKNSQLVASAVTTPFAKAMKERGLVRDNEAALGAALDAMAADAVDSDEDGITDIDELKADTDPNPVSKLPPPKYGCEMTAGPMGFMLSAFALGLRRRVGRRVSALRADLVLAGRR